MEWYTQQGLVFDAVNDNLEEMQKISEFLKTIKHKDVELLPYHKMGEHKYYALDMEFVAFDVPESKSIESYKKIFD